MLSKSHTNIYASKHELSEILNFINKFYGDLDSTKSQDFINFLVAENYINDNATRYKTIINTSGPVIKMNGLFINPTQELSKFDALINSKTAKAKKESSQNIFDKHYEAP